VKTSTTAVDVYYRAVFVYD